MENSKLSFLSPGSNSLRAAKRALGVTVFVVPTIWFGFLQISPITNHVIWNIIWSVPASLLLTAVTALLLYIMFILTVWVSMVVIAVLCYTEWLDEKKWEDCYEFLAKLQPIEDLK